jgi:ribosomal protein S18 acetylase RimI-like enzyme
MIQLREMTEAEFAEYKPLFIEEYAQDIARNYGLSIEDARERAASQADSSLSEGISTSNQKLYIILVEDGEATTPIGYLWLDVDTTKQRCFISDIYLHEESRGKGWGSKTLELLAKEMEALDITRIDLHVFGDKAVARGLYEKQGYQAVSVIMRKWLKA